MSLIKHKLLKKIESENDLDYNENPFIGHILTTNNVIYFRGLFMKVWATGPFLYKTQKVNKNWTLTYGIGIKQLSDGQEQFQVINMEWDGQIDEDGFRNYVIPSAYGVGEGAGIYAKKGSSPDKILGKNPETGEVTEIPTYMVDEERSQQSNGQYLYYYVYSINEPGSGYIDYFDTIGPCEGQKVYLHDEYFQLETEQAASAITKLEFSKEIRELPLGSLMYLTKLEEITLPTKLTQISRYTLANCRALSAVTIPSNVTLIDADAFYGCLNLTDMYFDNSVTMLPAGAPWGATNAVVRCRDGYFEGEIKYLYNKSGSEGNQYYRRCWGLDIVDAPNKGTLYAFVKQSEYDAYHNDYLVSISQGGIWSGNTEGALSHVSEICYVNEISGKTGSVMVAVPSVSGGTPVLDMPDGSVYVPVSIEDGVLTCPFGTFQHYDFLDYTDKSGGNSVQLYGFCNRIGYTKYQNESDAVFHERIVAGIEKDLEGGDYDEEDCSDIPFKMYLFNVEDDFTGRDFVYSAHTSWVNGDMAARIDKTSVSLPKYNILSSTTFTQGNVIVYNTGRDWLPVQYRRFAPLDIVVGNKTFYAFWNADFIDQYYQAGYGETFDGHCISGLSFEVESTYQTDGFSGSTVTILNGSLLYTDSLNTNVACCQSGELAYSSDLENVGYSFGYRTGYEYITISGGNVVSALCFMDIGAIETYDEETEEIVGYQYPSIVRYASGDTVVDGITYYCYKADDYMYYLTDISEGRKFRFYTTTPSGFSNNFVSFEDYGAEFLTSYSGLPTVTANSGNTISYTMVDDGTSFVFNYFEPYNVVIGNTTFYAYIPHEAYATAYRILSNAESGITSGLDTRLFTAIGNENGNSNLISNGKVQVLFMTDISQGVKGGVYMALMDVYQSNPNSYVGQIRLREKMYADMAEYDGEITCQITNNPDLDTTILVEKAIADGATIQMPFTIANGNINLSGMTLYPHPEFDTVVSGVTYYAFVDKNVSCEHNEGDAEAVLMLIGQLSNHGSVLPTGENSCKLLFTTAHGDGSYSGSTIYGGGVNIGVDAETGDYTIETYVSLNNGSGGSGSSGGSESSGGTEGSGLQVAFTVSGGTVTAPVFSSSGTTLYHYPAFDIVSGGTTYYALADVDVTMASGISQAEAASQLLGEMYDLNSRLQTSENSCDLFFVDTMVDGYYSDRSIYQGEMSRNFDAETGDGYIEINANVPSTTTQWEI